MAASSRPTNLPADVSKIRDEYEVEIVLEGDEIDQELKNRLKYCSKNPGHAGFHPVGEFKPEHLPDQWRIPLICHAVKDLSCLVVKLTVGYTSKNRSDDYDSASVRGTNCRRVGSGFAHIGETFLQMPTQLCPLTDCPVAAHPHQVTANFDVATAVHVVYDKSECLQTEVSFHLNSLNGSDSSIITAQPVGMAQSVGEWLEWCSISCISHDLDLFKKVLSYKPENLPPSPPPPVGTDPLIIVTGHPHGLRKYVTVGEITDIKRDFSTIVSRILTKFRGLGCSSQNNVQYHQHRVEKMFQHMGATLEKVDELCSLFPGVPGVNGDTIKNNILDLFQNLCATAVNSNIPGAHTPHANRSQGSSSAEAYRAYRDNLKDVIRKVNAGDLSVNDVISVRYTAPTCPGCSGGLVLVFFVNDDGEIQIGFHAPHLGVKRGANASVMSCIVKNPNMVKAVEKFFEKKNQQK